ncbi:YheC/YheD family protein [Ectobacillus sp. JY-23]|uniref:YheC/YheD family endospore coat-associated protein n=1 Tax=Ectobacillus sp. JY-23 TaxID=2933872 RepID=UPI001FF1F665|nr:YheC/YheD family protein [Ectobacillus sp. JY-23]UOY92037.1 YheC/YheD family protein [Ectobacillus sp. JY-23]
MMLGLLSIRATEMEYFTEIAKRGHLYNIQVVRFTPTDINPATELISGFLFHNETQTWKKEIFPIPSYIYDRCFYNGTDASRKARPIVEWLKKRPSTTFLGHGLPDKMQTYAILQKHKTVAHYLPATETATTENVWDDISKKGEVVLKPLQGSQGNGLCHIIMRRKSFEVYIQSVKDVKQEVFQTKEQLINWLNTTLHRPYVKQPYLSVQDRMGRPFDIRILLQKNEQGKWQEAGRGVRIGDEQSLVSNLNAGSHAFSYPTWKQSYPRRDIALFESDLHTLISAVPAALEKELPPLFEIGIDVAFDRNRAVWLLDVNSKPGRKVLLESNPSCAEGLYRAPLLYCHSLAKGADVL